MHVPPHFPLWWNIFEVRLKKKTFSSPEKCPSGIELKLPDVLMGDKAYPLKECLMRPYCKLELIVEVQGTQNSLIVPLQYYQQNGESSRKRQKLTQIMEYHKMSSS
jgi:hypothetical protein